MAPLASRTLSAQTAFRAPNQATACHRCMVHVRAKSGHFVQTDPELGLTEDAASRAIELLLCTHEHE